jgi:stage IV sporulation protein FB
VLLYEPDRTPFDLRFRLLGMDVRVHPLFWVVAAVLGWAHFTQPEPGMPGGGIAQLALWVACAFVSIVLHEMGHVLMGRAFGSDGHIVLYTFGGLAVGSTGVRARWQRIAVLAAGPGVQLLLWAFLWGLTHLPAMQQPLKDGVVLRVVLGMLLWINLYWPLLNLLPIWPLDGGQITREVCEGVSRSQGVVVSLWVSLIVSAVLAVNALLATKGQRLIPYMPVGTFMAIFFAMFAVGSYQALQVERTQKRFWDDHWH